MFKNIMNILLLVCIMLEFVFIVYNGCMAIGETDQGKPIPKYIKNNIIYTVINFIINMLLYIIIF